MLEPGNRLNWGGVGMLGSSRISHLGLLYRGRQVLTEWLHRWTGSSVGSQLIGLILNEATISCAGQSLDHINVPHGQSY